MLVGFLPIGSAGNASDAGGRAMLLALEGAGLARAEGAVELFADEAAEIHGEALAAFGAGPARAAAWMGGKGLLPDAEPQLPCLLTALLLL